MILFIAPASYFNYLFIIRSPRRIVRQSRIVDRNLDRNVDHNLGQIEDQSQDRIVDQSLGRIADRSPDRTVVHIEDGRQIHQIRKDLLLIQLKTAVQGNDDGDHDRDQDHTLNHLYTSDSSS